MDPTVEVLTDLLVILLKHDSAKAQTLRALVCGVFPQSEYDRPAVAHNDVVGAALAEANDTALLWLLERLQLPQQ
jgi:hypothetical protein